MKILITSGGCKVPIDHVRHIGNFSSGRYGSELANAFMQNTNNHVYFLHEKGSMLPSRWKTNGMLMYNINDYQYKDYYEYVDKVKNLIIGIQPDIIISAAAISDYILDKTEGKISSDNDELVIKLRKSEKVIKSFKELAPKAYIVGFKLLVSPTVEEKYKALESQLKYVDVSVYNDLTKLRSGESGRELVYWAEDGKIGSDKNLAVSEMVEELLVESFMNKVLNQ